MSARPGDEPAARPRPRPQPAESPRPIEAPRQTGPPRSVEARRTIEQKPAAKRRQGRRPGRQLARLDAAQPAQVVASAGHVVVGAAKIGRILGRSSWRLARQLPGLAVVEGQAQKLRGIAGNELARLIELPQGAGPPSSPEEQRVLNLVQDADLDPQPLRTAMGELLERSTHTDGERSREYLFGTIVSQLVPDEARVLATLAGGHPFAAVDVVAKQIGRAATRPVLSNASTIAAAAGLSRPRDIGTYLGRLRSFGLIAFGAPESDLDSQFDVLITDPAVADAKADIEKNRQGSAKIVRKSLRLSPLGREFWTACTPLHPRLAPRR